jgi:Spy/CpxP family protein refolding chaperone
MVAAQPQPGPVKPDVRPPKPPLAAPPDGQPRPTAPAWNDPQLAERLGMNSDQRKKIEAAVQEHRLKQIDLRAAVEKARVMLEPLVAAEQPDEGRILAQIDRVAQAEAELRKDEMRLQLEIRRALTPEQWRRLQQERQARLRPAGPPPTVPGPEGRGPQGPPVN